MVYTKKGRGKSKGTKKELTVKWKVLKDKKIIKFIEEENKTYKLADNVLEYLDEIKSGVPVNVTVIGDTVTFIQKRETDGEEYTNEAPEEDYEPEKEETVQNSEGETYTVKAISKTRDYYLFEECGDKEWFTVAKNVKNFLKDVKKGDALEVKVEVSNDGKRDTRTIVFATVKATKEKEPEKKTETVTTQKKSSYRDEDATDKRTAVMTAKDLVVALLNAEKIDNKQIKEVLTDLTKTCYKAIQSL